MLLVGRLMQIQLFETEHFSKHEINLLEESVAQRSQEIVIDSGRGGFLDKEWRIHYTSKYTCSYSFSFFKKYRLGC